MRWTTAMPAWLPIAVIGSVALQSTPPTSAQRAAAIGPTEGLPEALRRALQPAHDFQPIPPPGPADWLANHREAGQSFEQFVRSRPNRPDQRRRKLYLQPIGSFSQGEAPALDELVRFA